jgi:hypothetical protein
MSPFAARFEYPQSEIPLILRSSFQDDMYYGVDILESRKMKIILAKYGSRHSFHSLPGKVSLNLHPFVWDRLKQVFRIELTRKVPIQLNTLEEAIINHPIFEEG